MEWIRKRSFNSRAKCVRPTPRSAARLRRLRRPCQHLVAIRRPPSFQVSWRAAVVLPFVCGIPLPPCDHRSRLNGPNTPLRLAEVSHHDVRTGPLEGTPPDPCSLMISRRGLVEGRAIGLFDRARPILPLPDNPWAVVILPPAIRYRKPERNLDLAALQGKDRHSSERPEIDLHARRSSQDRDHDGGNSHGNRVLRSKPHLEHLSVRITEISGEAPSRPWFVRCLHLIVGRLQGTQSNSDVLRFKAAEPDTRAAPRQATVHSVAQTLMYRDSHVPHPR